MILSLMKFVEEREYAESFLRGELYMNTLEFFAKMEADEVGRADNYEGVYEVCQPENISLTISIPEEGLSWEISRGALAAPARFSRLRAADFNVCCLFAMHTEGTAFKVNPETGNLWLPEGVGEEAMQALLPSIDATQMGGYVVLIHDVDAFYDRVDEAIDRLGDERELGRFGRGLVTYYDPDVLHGEVPGPHEVLCKRNAFAHQREYRLFLETLTREPFVFNVGDLSDIAYIMTVEELASAVQLSFLGETEIAS